MAIVKLAALGDIVMASTLVGAIRARWPDAHITWIAGRAFAPLVARYRGVDAVVAVDDAALLAGHGLRRLGAAARAAWAVGRGPFDLGLVAHGDARYGRLLALARVGEVRALRDAERPRGPRPGVWFGIEYARLLRDDATWDGEAPPLASLDWPYGNPPARREVREVLLAPGGARNVLRDDHLRRWPVAHWVSLAERLVAAGLRVTLIGAAGDREEAAAVAAVDGVENRVGGLALTDTLARIASASLLVAHDSGPAHLAALVRTPAVVLFGPTDPRTFVAPFADVRVASAAAGLACAPCYDGRGYAPCADNRCLRDVSPASVAALVLDRLAGGVGAEGLEPPTSAV